MLSHELIIVIIATSSAIYKRGSCCIDLDPSRLVVYRQGVEAACGDVRLGEYITLHETHSNHAGGGEECILASAGHGVSNRILSGLGKNILKTA